MVRFRSPRNAYFFQVSPAFVAVITAFFFFLRLVLLLYPVPHPVSFVISRRKVRQNRRVRCGRKRGEEDGEILSFLFLIKFPRSFFPIFLLSLLIIGARYTLVYLQAMSVACVSRSSFSSSARYRRVKGGRASWKPIDREKATIRMRSRFRFPVMRLVKIYRSVARSTCRAVIFLSRRCSHESRSPHENVS